MFFDQPVSMVLVGAVWEALITEDTGSVLATVPTITNPIYYIESVRPETPCEKKGLKKEKQRLLAYILYHSD